jgi:hypothetical protein
MLEVQGPDLVVDFAPTRPEAIREEPGERACIATLKRISWFVGKDKELFNGCQVKLVQEAEGLPRERLQHHIDVTVMCPPLRRLELITRAPLEEGIYEALINYDTPGEPPAYWTAERLSYLSDEARARMCQMSVHWAMFIH